MRTISNRLEHRLLMPARLREIGLLGLSYRATFFPEGHFYVWAECLFPIPIVLRSRSLAPDLLTTSLLFVGLTFSARAQLAPLPASFQPAENPFTDEKAVLLKPSGMAGSQTASLIAGRVPLLLRPGSHSKVRRRGRFFRTSKWPKGVGLGTA
jgi:hypothetical protein